LQSWLSPAFPTGAYSYSHGLEAAIESSQIRTCHTLVDWVDADLRYGSARNDAIVFVEAWRCGAGEPTTRDCWNCGTLGRVPRNIKIRARGVAAGTSCLATLRAVWPHQGDRLAFGGARLRRIQ
jgi:urease accessory protein